MKRPHRTGPASLAPVPRRTRQAVPPEGRRSRRPRRPGRRRQAPRARGAPARRRRDRRPAGSSLRAGSLVAAAGVPGHRRRRQGQRDQARDVGRESAGLPGLLVQVPVFRRPRSRLPVAIRQGAARTGTHRHLQPLLLRRDRRRPGAPRTAREAESPARAARREGSVEGTRPRHLQFRGLPVEERHAGHGSSSSTSPRRSRASASANGSTSPRRTGSSRPPI